MHIWHHFIYFVFQSTFMPNEEQHTSLETLQEIRSIMDRSARFITLSGWSGIWAGITALAAALLAQKWINVAVKWHYAYDRLRLQLLVLALVVFVIALAGAFLFTYRKTKKNHQPMWNAASRQLLLHGAIPLLAGAVFSLCFLYNGDDLYIAPSCLVFYGLALINASKYTLSDIRYLGLLEVILACICLFYPAYGLYFWAAGFGILHILYGLVMWKKYDKPAIAQ